MDDQPKSSTIPGFKLPIKIGTKPLIIIGVVTILVIAAGGYWYWSQNKQAPSAQGAPSLGGEIFDKTQNQLEGQVPDVNPFKDQKNPFDAIYQNPFK